MIESLGILNIKACCFCGEDHEKLDIKSLGPETNLRFSVCPNTCKVINITMTDVDYNDYDEYAD